MQEPWWRTLVPQSGHSSQDALTNCCGEQPSHVTHPVVRKCHSWCQHALSWMVELLGDSAGHFQASQQAQPGCQRLMNAVPTRRILNQAASALSSTLSTSPFFECRTIFLCV